VRVPDVVRLCAYDLNVDGAAEFGGHVRFVVLVEDGDALRAVGQVLRELLVGSEDREQDMLRMDVIVGQEFQRTQTPVFAAEMKHVILRPYWNVPQTIATRELLPELRAHPGRWVSEHFEIVRGWGDNATRVPATAENMQLAVKGKLRVRQQPGPRNALGLIALVLPNRYDVFLHSTPAPALFRRARRSFSHGCIRVSDPIGLAEQVLSESPDSWSRAKITQAIAGDTSIKVLLAKPLQVLILYGTAIATEDGAVHFFEDLYGHDARLNELLGKQAQSAR